MGHEAIDLALERRKSRRLRRGERIEKSEEGGKEEGGGEEAGGVGRKRK